jgi:Ca-activated chloride channel family protein
MTNEIEQGLHEKLCAYVLGEASEEVRVEIERALEGSEDLRAERVRLEKTIGLVREAMTGSESLSASAAEILADARRPRGRPWYAQPSLRIAAGITAVAWAGVFAFRAMESRHDAESIDIAARSTDARKYPSTPEPAPEKEAQGETGNELFTTFEKDKLQDAPADSTTSSSAPLVAVAESDGQALPGSSVTVRSLERLDEMKKQGYAEGEKPGDLTDLFEVESHMQPDAAEQSSAIGVGAPGAAPSPAPARAARPPAFAGRAKGRAPLGPATGGGAPAAPRLGPIGYTGSGSTLGKGEEAKDRRLGLRYSSEDLDRVSGDDEEQVLGGDLSVLDQIRRLDPPDREKWVDEQCRRIVSSCRRRPNERPRDMFFRFYGDNPFELAALDPLSTFSVDVDTASYALARRYINEGHIPEKAQVRTEEFINYFKADVPPPTKGVFAIHTDLAPSRFGADKSHWMLRVVVRGKDVSKAERKPLNLTFVIDVSGSMREQNRLEMVKHAIRLLVDQLGTGDNIALVAFSDDARTVLPMTSVRNRTVIEQALYPLQPESSTNSEAGLKLGYSIALANLNPEAQNRVVFLSDGVANVGETDPARLSETIKPIREKGVYLNTIGVGMNNHNDVLLEQLADKGDGVCSYIDSDDEAKHVIVDGFAGAFDTIARDVKVQVEFDPAQVLRYRLLGYENRAIADKDFRNDKIDAGEVGAGHQVTALYELELGSGSPEKALATVRLRWKAPRNVNAPTANEEATEMTAPVSSSRRTTFEGAGPGYRRAIVVAQFAEFLRRSIHARGDSLDDLILEADKLLKETSDPEVGELVVLLHKSKKLILDALPPCDDLCQAIDAVRRNEMLRAERELLARDLDSKTLTDLEKQNADLEQQIRDLLRRKIEQRAR